MANASLIQKVLANAGAYEDQPPEAVLAFVIETMGRDVVQANSLGPEDVVITHMLSALDSGFKSFTLDTGRLNPETYELMDRLKQKYDLDLKIMFPDNKAVEVMVKNKGINLFYDSIENRQQCCQVRKIEPLKRVLSEFSGWICGLRREQSPTRTQVAKIEIDAGNGGIIKVNPLADWTSVQVWNYIKANSLPYNRLHDSGYASIGCAPCTRAIKPGESERSGRWWWENPDSKECGLHGGKS
jgi:phosphoadenosine phosphosulfate reductase